MRKERIKDNEHRFFFFFEISICFWLNIVSSSSILLIYFQKSGELSSAKKIISNLSIEIIQEYVDQVEIENEKKTIFMITYSSSLNTCTWFEM